jgi:DNA-binding NarL/FixJ family response regulator
MSKKDQNHRDVSLQPRRKWRIYIVDDSGFRVEALRRLIEETPEQDLECAGDCRANPPDLADRIQKAKADVVLVDLALALGVKPEIVVKEAITSGLFAITALRARFGKTVKLIAYSAYMQFRDGALEAGANTFMTLSSNEEIQATIHAVIYADPPPPSDMFTPTGLALFFETEERYAIVIGDRANSQKLPLEPKLFAFLYYLAEERACGETGWVEKTENEELYHMRCKEFWHSVCDRFGGGYQPGDLLKKWRRRINEMFEQYLLKEGLREIITGPGRGQRQGRYSLVTTIKPEVIAFHGQRVDLPKT